MECISNDNTVTKVNSNNIKGVIMEMCCSEETTNLTLITDAEEPKHLHADDVTTVYNMCKFTAAIEDALDMSDVAIVIATYGLAGNKSRVFVVLPWVNED